MKFLCYILYSKSIDRYYVGYTSDIEERIKLHNSGSFGYKSYIYKASDWNIFLTIPCDTIEQAVFIEIKIKSMKSRKKYPEIIERILQEDHK